MENKSEEKLIIAKLNDKIKFCKTKNKIVNTEFLNMYQESIIRKELERIKENNYIFTGGYEEAESKLLILYPEKLTENLVFNNIKNIIKAIKIVLPNDQVGKYEHRDYLGTIMQFGLVRERIGDIIVHEDSAYIIVLQENAQYIKDSFITTKKFKKSKIEIIEVDEIEVKKPEFEELKITVNSLRLDNFVSEIAKVSRNEAYRLIENEQVSVNCKTETKQTKQIGQGDVLIIRRKGKFIVDEFLNLNKKGKQIVIVKKYKWGYELINFYKTLFKIKKYDINIT